MAKSRLKIPFFEWKETPKLSYGLLGGKSKASVRPFLEEYFNEVKRHFDDNENLNTLRFNRAIYHSITEFNLFSTLLMNSLLAKREMRVASIKDLAILEHSHDTAREVLSQDALWELYGRYRGNSHILGVVIWSSNESDKNKKILEDLDRELKDRNHTFSRDNPIFIDIDGLDLKKNKKSAYGLSLGLKDEAVPINAPCFYYDNRSYDWLYHKMPVGFKDLDARGLPIISRTPRSGPDYSGRYSITVNGSGISTLRRTPVNFITDFGFCADCDDLEGTIGSSPLLVVRN